MLGRHQQHNDNNNDSLYHCYDHIHRINVKTPSCFNNDPDNSLENESSHFINVEKKVLVNRMNDQEVRAVNQDSLLMSSIEDEATNISSNFFASGMIIFSLIA